jgi:hypothetical protein
MSQKEFRVSSRRKNWQKDSRKRKERRRESGKKDTGLSGGCPSRLRGRAPMILSEAWLMTGKRLWEVR